MVKRPPLLVALDQFVAGAYALPPHEFHIGENNHASLDQLPPFRPMAFWVIGKAPMPLPDNGIDTTGLGVYALGTLIGDALFKLMRPWPLAPGQWFRPDAEGGYIDDIASGLLPLSPQAEGVRYAFLARINELLDIGLHQPERLPAIVTNIDALTNARLTERAGAVLMSGTDPGQCDLWEWTPPKHEGATR